MTTGHAHRPNRGDSPAATDHQSHGGETPTADELREMTPEQAMIAGAEVDGIHIVHRRNRFPVPGTKAEKRAERGVAICFLISALSGFGFIVAFIAIPFHWHLPGTPQNFRFFTPAIGGLLALMLTFIGIGMVLWAKWLMPEEEAIQDRHDVPSTEEDKLMTEASFLVGLEDTGLPRRGLILKTLGLAGGALATVPLVALVGAMIKKPGDALFHTLFRPNKKLFPPNGHVPIVRSDFTRVGPGDLEPGAVMTVFPGVREAGQRLQRGHRRVLADAADPAQAGPDDQVPQGPGRLRLAVGQPGVRRVLQDLHARRLPGLAVRAADLAPAVPLPPVAVRGSAGRQAGLRPGHAQPAETAARRGDGAGWQAVLRRTVGLQRSDRPRLLGAPMTTSTARRTGEPRTRQGKAAKWADDRLLMAGPIRKQLNKVFPDHWSFMMGEIALYSFIILLLTGTYLTFFFDPSMAETTYHGRYVLMDGVTMSRAYESTLNITFDVRGGLVIRQIHHWAALLFLAAMLVHMFRVFFTGAFRKPRELNWLIGLGLIGLGIVEGFAGYSLPDDLLSGTGLRIADAIMLSIPVIGTWVSFLVFGGPFPGDVIIGRLYIAHVLLIPAILLALIGAHLALVVRQKHTQFPGPGRTEDTRHRRAGVPGLRREGRRLLLHRVRRVRAARRSRPDQPGVVVRPVRAARGVLRLPARLVHDVPRRFDPPVPVLGDQAVPPHRSTVVLAHRRPAGHPVHPRRAVSVHRGEDDRATRPNTICCSARATSPSAPRSAAWRSPSTGAVPLRRQRHHRQDVRHLAERHDVGRPHRPAGHPAGGLPAGLPRLPGPAAARPRGARARRRDRHHQGAADR